MIQHSALIERLALLEANVLDPVLFGPGFYRDEEEGGGINGRGIAVGTGAAVGAGGAYLGHRGIMRNYGGGEGGAVQAYRNAGRNVGRSASEASAAAMRRGAGVLDPVKARTSSAAHRAMDGVRRAGKAVKPLLRKLPGASRLPILASTGGEATRRLVELSHNLESVDFAFYVPKKVSDNISDEELDQYGGIAIDPTRLAKTAIAGGVGGAGFVAARAGHRAVMRNYGGEGGARQAYRNVGRNVARVPAEAVAGAKRRVTAGVASARVSMGRNKAQGKPMSVKLKRAGSSFLRAVRK